MSRRRSERPDRAPQQEQARPGGRARDDASLPLVALVGRPNVGKSSLFNRLVGGRPALVEDMPGVTRDRRYGVVEWGRHVFRAVDTGGLDPSAEGILRAMRAQTLRAVEEAAVLVFVVDGVEGASAVDEDVAALLRRASKPVLVAVNKVDSATRDAATAEGFRLGFRDVFPISATHGRGVNDLLDAVVAALGDKLAPPPAQTPADGADDAEPAPPAVVRLAFVGKPNVGKSSLMNRLLGDERVLVHDAPGTTRDPIDAPFEADGRKFVLVDTAGLRKRRVLKTQTEAVADMMARDQLARADVAAIVIDAQLGATGDDARLAGLVEESGRAALIVLNKSDLVPRAQLDARIASTRETLQFLAWAPVVITSAVTGRQVLDIPAAAARAFDAASARVPTAELNRVLAELVEKRPPPSGRGGRQVRFYYAAQVGLHPPTFAITSNQPAAVPFSYRRYLANQFRKTWDFEGTPIRVHLRPRSSKEAKADRG